MEITTIIVFQYNRGASSGLCGANVRVHKKKKKEENLKANRHYLSE